MIETPPGLSYCRGRFKRIFDLLLSATALVALSPLFLVVALVLLVVDGRPVLFIQERVGVHGSPFKLMKFRTMRALRSGGSLVTARGDQRITGLGRLLRASKLDELPQLVNVLVGEMSLVGPRPELPRYVEHYTEKQREVLEARPGLTDPATLYFRNEERLLAAVDPEEREDYYIQEIIPKKLDMNLIYLDRAGPMFDLSLILRTLIAIASPGRS